MTIIYCMYVTGAFVKAPLSVLGFRGCLSAPWPLVGWSSCTVWLAEPLGNPCVCVQADMEQVAAMEIEELLSSSVSATEIQELGSSISATEILAGTRLGAGAVVFTEVQTLS